MNPCAPRFLLPLSGTVEVTEGESFVLEVRVHGHPQPEIEWFKNGQELNSSYSTLPQGKLEMRINNVTQNHTGEYRCTAVNQSGRVSSAMWLAVVPKHYPSYPGPPQPENMRREQKNMFYFNNPLSNVDDVDSVNLKRTGSLDCITPNKTKFTDLPKNFERPISPRRRAPGFLGRPASCEITPGSKLSLSAKLLGHPPPTVIWEKDGFQLSEKDERIQMYNQNNTHSLEIESVNYTDSGKYKIIARNPLGRQHATCNVVVDKNAFCTSNSQIKNEPIKNIQPIVVTPKNMLPSNRTSLEKSTFDMHIENNAVREKRSNSVPSQHNNHLPPTQTPTPTQTRFVEINVTPPNSTVINPSPPGSIVTDYFNVNNTSSETSSSITKYDNLPKIVQPLEDKISHQGDTLTLHCRISDWSANQISASLEDQNAPKWCLNGVKIDQITNSKTKFVTRQFGDIHRLRIINIDPAAAGEYSIHIPFGASSGQEVIDSCFVKCTSQVGIVLEESSSLSPFKQNGQNWVKNNDSRPLQESCPKVIEPNFILGLRDVTVQEGEIVILSVEVAGNPEPTVRFFFEDERFIHDPVNGISVINEGRNYKLILEDANPDDGGNYSCLARNELGQQIETYCRVTVNRKPPFINHIPGEVNVYYGEQFSLEIESDGDFVTWSYDESTPQRLSDTRFRFQVDKVLHGGQIIITSTNGGPVTQARTNLNILKKKILPPVVEFKLPSEKKIDLGDRVSFPIDYIGEDVEVKWHFNGTALSSDFQVTQSSAGNKHSTCAIILNMTIALIGQLSCTLSNEGGQVKSVCSIDYARKPPVLVTTPNEKITFQEGEPAGINFDFTGIPKPNPTWTRTDNLPVNGRVCHQNMTSSIFFDSIKMTDAGQYLFRIENEAGIAQYETKIEVCPIPVPEIPLPDLLPPTQELPTHASDGLKVLPVLDDYPARIIEGLKDKTFAEGEDIVLRCRVEGKPSPTVSWSLGEEAIWSGPPDEGGLSELILKDCWSDDMGVYKIQVLNSLGSDESTCNVIVQQRLKPMLEPLGPIEPMETILEVSEMSSRATSADHSRTTSADSHKTETKTNFKDHFCLTDNLNDSVQLSTIESANDLILSSTQIKRPPYFFQKPANREISDGEKNFIWETFICEALRVEISKMNEETKEWELFDDDDSEFQITKDGDKISFKFNEVFPDDAGKYKFRAINNDGECEIISTLSVIPVEGVGPSFVTKPRSREFKLGTAAIFSCVVEGDPTPEIKWEIGGNPVDPSRMVIHESVLEDKSTRSEITIRNLCQGDVGRGMVYAQNIHNTIQCQFSVLLVSNEEPAPVTDFRFNLKNRVQTKAMTAEDIQGGSIQQFDFRSNLKKSKTNENLSDLRFDDAEDQQEVEIDPELQEKLNKRLQKSSNDQIEKDSFARPLEIETPEMTSQIENDVITESRLNPLTLDRTQELMQDSLFLNSVSPTERQSATYIIPDEYPTVDTSDNFERILVDRPSCDTTVDMIRSESDSGGQSEIGQLQMTDIELSKSRNSIHSHNSSSSKASTVLNSMMEHVKHENESDQSDVIPETNSVPVIISGLRDQCIKLASPFSLSVTVENVDTVTWMLEQQVIEAEPEEGLVLRQNGNEYILEVSSSMEEDMGTYDVICENEFGQKRSNCFVTIIK